MVSEIWSAMDHCLPFYSPNNPKNENFEKLKKVPGDIFILQMFTINDNHILYGYWAMKRDGQNFLSFWTVFCSGGTPDNPKNTKIEKLKKTLGDIIILYMCPRNVNHIMYGSWDTERDRQIFFVTLDHFLPFYPSKNLNNQNFKELLKMPRDIIILEMRTINHNNMINDSWDMKRDGQNFLSFWTGFCSFTPLTAQKIKILK